MAQDDPMATRRAEPDDLTAIGADHASAPAPDLTAGKEAQPGSEIPMDRDAARGGERAGWAAGILNWRPGLPAKLLFLTIAFVLLAEVLIFVPSIANFRVKWLQDRLQAAHIASLAVDVAEGGRVPQQLRQQLLRTAGVQAISIKTDTQRRLILPASEPLVIDAAFDVNPISDDTILGRLGRQIGLIGNALYVFMAPPDRMLRVYGTPPGADAAMQIDVILKERALCEAMARYAFNILILSIIISVIAAAMVFVALTRLLVDPMMRIADNMVSFAAAPEDPNRIIEPSGRRDEIGVTERELARMQTLLAQAFKEKNRLAELGLAVSKINHDLRNMLSSAQLISDRLGMLPDPTVQRFAPKLIASLDRAINFCNDTLKFGRAAEAPPRRDVFAVDLLLQEVADGLDLPRDDVGWELDVAPSVTADADREHLHRVLNNICRNAIDALEARKVADARIRVSARRDGTVTRLVVADNGPGVPEKARQNMFRAFQGNARPGGTGLGLAISAELIRAHGGAINLLDTDDGAAFEIVLPDRRPLA